jgi:hypothetical protein
LTPMDQRQPFLFQCHISKINKIKLKIWHPISDPWVYLFF